MAGFGRPAEYSSRTPVRVEFYTRSYHVSGDVDLTRWRLAELLNTPSAKFVTIQNAVREPLPEIAKAGGADLARATPVLQIARDSIILAIPHESSETASARHSLLSALHSERRPAAATAITPPFEIHSTVHLKRVAQSRQALEELPAEFLPVTDVDATYLLDPRLRVSAEFAVLNRPLAELFTLASDSLGRIARDRESRGTPAT